ncbi:endonuclease/exonuclease/phosphatase family protein [Neorhizobium sp. JUb45]|uniref:endonuclease/exonuclease/phosphatase family protein n=1 Tax=unclassified Neorhizobium TaxID=2629175 RepID=UPI0010442A45|nr:endonuclease/exonuclease/phosphatase family protein [Neorhizobium sp. JUb45]TCR06197.1 endonuclease/exonuclease/phosphatase family metal-dependent hydrolase [Neorhizobium sp. JUb45]
MNDRPTISAPITPETQARQLRILSYNVHSCIGTDKKLDPARIADVIAGLEPDIIGLQELDVGRKRSGGIDQAHAIASLLKMDFHFHPALRVEEENYGDAILSAFPTRLIKADALPSYGEPRGALWAEIDIGGRPLQVFNTHLGLFRRERVRQSAIITGPDWIGHPDALGKPRLLMGDFNSIPSSPAYRQLASTMRDIGVETGKVASRTFPSRFPLLRLDHVFVAGGPKIIEAKAVSTPLTRLASDHLPLLVTIEF